MIGTASETWLIQTIGDEGTPIAGHQHLGWAADQKNGEK
jgi:hypothetical protein